MKLKQRKLIINIVTVAAIILAVLCVYVGLQISLSTNRPLLALATGSMRPALEIGDLLIIQGVQATSIRVGDIIVFKPPEGSGLESPTVHRVVRIESSEEGTLQFKTKGDDNPNEDLFWVPEDHIYGRVIHRIPYLGYIALNPAIPIILIMITAIVLLLWPEKTKRFRRKHRRT